MGTHSVNKQFSPGFHSDLMTSHWNKWGIILINMLLSDFTNFNHRNCLTRSVHFCDANYLIWYKYCKLRMGYKHCACSWCQFTVHFNIELSFNSLCLYLHPSFTHACTFILLKEQQTRFLSHFNVIHHILK